MKLLEYREQITASATRDEWEAFSSNQVSEICDQIRRALRRHPKRFTGLIAVTFDSRSRRMADVLRAFSESVIPVENQTGRAVVRDALAKDATP